MEAAQDEIDLIHEAEKEAKSKIEAAEQRARAMKGETDAKSRKIESNAEKEAQDKAKAIMNGIDGKKIKIEASMQKETDAIIAEIQESAKKKKPSAIDTIVKMLVGEE